MILRVTLLAATTLLSCAFLRSAHADGSATSISQFGTAPPSPIIDNDDERAAFKAGREYVFTTGNNGVATNPGNTVASGSFLHTRICNTSTTRTWYIAPFGRFIDTNSTVATEYFGVNQPDALSGSQTATLSNGNTNAGSNLGKPGTPQTDITYTFGVGTALMTCNSGAVCAISGNGIIYPGEKNEISKPRAMLPGTCFGQTLVGQSNATNGLGGSAAAFFVYRTYMYYDQ